MTDIEYRIEHDTMGEVRVPKDALYAAQTQRAVENFPISGDPLEPALIDAQREYTEGKLRLLYEANPIAYLIEQAGGIATTGKGRVLDVMPTAIHQRTPLVVGGQAEMKEFLRLVPHEL